MDCNSVRSHKVLHARGFFIVFAVYWRVIFCTHLNKIRHLVWKSLFNVNVMVEQEEVKEDEDEAVESEDEEEDETEEEEEVRIRNCSRLNIVDIIHVN